MPLIDTDQVRTQARADFAANASLREEFNDDEAAYVAFATADAQGRVKSVRSVVVNAGSDAPLAAADTRSNRSGQPGASAQSPQWIATKRGELWDKQCADPGGFAAWLDAPDPQQPGGKSTTRRAYFASVGLTVYDNGIAIERAGNGTL